MRWWRRWRRRPAGFAYWFTPPGVSILSPRKVIDVSALPLERVASLYVEDGQLKYRKPSGDTITVVSSDAPRLYHPDLWFDGVWV